MKIDLIKKNSIVEKDGAFMPLAFVDVAMAAIALNGKAIGHEIRKEFKKNVFPLPEFQRLQVVENISDSMAEHRVQLLRSSIDDIEI